ncbi:hypothetical protein ABPG75_011157 [Micractinium tetrahymenae]
MAQGLAGPSETAAPSSTAPGLPKDTDRITYLLQFPLRPPWRPYHEDKTPLRNVKLKPKVTKLQCEVPLDTRSRNYNENVEPVRKISAVTLQSSRLDMRTTFAAGFVEEDRLLLFPVDEALQLRPSLAHLDKEKETAAKKKGKGEEEEEQQQQKAPELMQLTVQVKRRETEQQAEARLRSYAHLAAQEEADQWVPLEYHGEASELAQSIWTRLAGVGGAPEVAATLSREQYLDAIVPGSSTLHGQETGATWAAGAMAARDLGKPASVGAKGSQLAEDAPVPTELQPAIIASTLTLLRAAQVVSIDQVRAVLARQGEPPVKAAAATASDAALHAAVIASGEVMHLRKSYFVAKLGNATLDPLRNVVIELLKENEQLRRSDIIEAAKARGLAVSDTLYSKVVKELCTSRGSIWSLK